MSFLRYRLSSILACSVPALALANNIQVSNVTLTGQNAGSNTYQVQFDISWENSWRTSTAEANYDAAWIFLKFRLDPSLPWNHATLSLAGHVQPSGSTIQVPADLMGAFLFRSANGIGNVNFTGAQLQWNYGASGVADNAVIEVRVMAVEMVFVPSGSFTAGDGRPSSFERDFHAGGGTTPYTIGSENLLTLGGVLAANMCSHNNTSSGSGADDFTNATTQTLPAAFPKGFNAYYAMKYEVTEGQYVDFLNMLTSTQASSNFPNQTGSQGHTIDDNAPAPEIYVTTAQERAVGFLTGMNVLAYADWAAMRPMTELEYEKACRGNRPAVVNEFAWGNLTIRATGYTLSNAAATNESVNALGTQGNANYTSVNTGNVRPWRSGIFPGSLVSPDRAAAGAGYYGAMDLSGNVLETVVTVGSSAGRGFTGNHGDGALTAAGAANTAGWPSSGSPLTFRGGGFASLIARLNVSDRSESILPLNVTTAASGFRLCRLP